MCYDYRVSWFIKKFSSWSRAILFGGLRRDCVRDENNFSQMRRAWARWTAGLISIESFFSSDYHKAPLARFAAAIHSNKSYVSASLGSLPCHSRPRLPILCTLSRERRARRNTEAPRRWWGWRRWKRRIYRRYHLQNDQSLRRGTSTARQDKDDPTKRPCVFLMSPFKGQGTLCAAVIRAVKVIADFYNDTAVLLHSLPALQPRRSLINPPPGRIERSALPFYSRFITANRGRDLRSPVC